MTKPLDDKSPSWPAVRREQCGDVTGYWMHLRRRELACLRCLRAAQIYDDDKRQAPRRRAELAAAVADSYTAARRKRAS